MKKVNFRLDPDVKSRVEALAQRLTRLEGREVSASEVYRRATKQYLDYREAESGSPHSLIDY